MADRITPRAERVLKQPLSKWVRERRQRSWSWAKIARELYLETNVEVTGETLRTRYPDPAEPDGVAPAA